MNRTVPKELLASIQKSGLHKPDHCAFVLDFTSVPTTRSRTVFCSFVRYFQYGCLQNLTPRILSDHTFVLTMPNDQRSRMEELVENVRTFLLARRYGGLDCKVFDLSEEASAFAPCCVGHMRAITRENAEDFLDFYLAPPKNVTQLGQLVEIERIIGQADISMHIRSQLIWELLPESTPALAGEEFWVSIAAMEEISGKEILNDEWMFARFTELLDNRVLSYVTKENYTGDVARFLNLNPVAVVSANFQRMIKTIPSRQLRKLTVEIPLLMWRNNPKVRQGILSRFQRHGIRLAFDRVPLSRLTQLLAKESEIADFIKLHVADCEPDEIRQTLDQCSPDLINKIVFCRCETVAQIEAGVQAGVSYFQGYGLAGFLDAPVEIERVLGKATAKDLPRARLALGRARA